jgi:leucyl aminopeptidase (aminopeptidase T)
MTADFFAIRERAERLAALWRRTDEVRVTSSAGTDLRATVAGREPMAWLTGICRNPGEVSALPGGEVSLPPIEGTAEGVVVWERVASDLGALDAPVHIEVHDGRATTIRGGAAAERLRDIVATVRDADNIGEIGIGLNPAARIADEITEAKKAFGTVHIALGDSANEYGGLVECDVHLDGLVMAPTIEFDGRAIVVDGRHVYDAP